MVRFYCWLDSQPCDALGNASHYLVIRNKVVDVECGCYACLDVVPITLRCPVGLNAARGARPLGGVVSDITRAGVETSATC